MIRFRLGPFGENCRIIRNVPTKFGPTFFQPFESIKISIERVESTLADTDFRIQFD